MSTSNYFNNAVAGPVAQGRAGRNLIQVRSPTNNMRDYDHVPADLNVCGSASYATRKARLSSKNTRIGVSSIDSEGGKKSKLGYGKKSYPMVKDILKSGKDLEVQ